MSPTLLLIGGSAAIFAAIVLTLLAAGVLNDGRSNAARSLALLDAFTSAPQSMKDELDPGFRQRVFDPFLGRLTGVGRRLTPSDNSNRLRQKLDAAGNPAGWSPDRVTALKAGGFAASLVLALVICMVIGLSLLPTLAVAIGVSLFGSSATSLWL